MAIHKDSPFAPALSGKMGSVVFRNAGSKNVVARNGQRIHRDSAAQQLHRGRFKQTVSHWPELTDEQRLAWRNAALNYRHTNRLGEIDQITGFQLYQRCNAGRLAAGLDLLDEPPGTLGPIPVTEPWLFEINPVAIPSLYYPDTDLGIDLYLNYVIGRSFAHSPGAQIRSWSPIHSSLVTPGDWDNTVVIYGAIYWGWPISEETLEIRAWYTSPTGQTTAPAIMRTAFAE